MANHTADKITVDLLVLGGGPGGYTAAFRAADLGLSVALVEERKALGGVCLNVGCIPSKALLHTVQVIGEAQSLDGHGIKFSQPEICLNSLREWKDGIVKNLSNGLSGLARQRKVTVLSGTGKFIDTNSVLVNNKEVVDFRQAIIAVGSRPNSLAFLPDDSRIMDSTSALMLQDIPHRLLVIGGGVIGLEMAEIYSGLGSQVSVVEVTRDLLPGCDEDLVRLLRKRIDQYYEAVLTDTKVTNVEPLAEGLKVTFDGRDSSSNAIYDRILVAVGRQPNSDFIEIDKAGIALDANGFICVNEQQRTNVPHIFAIGDVVGYPMLAHKASYEGKVAAEVAAGLSVANDAKVIPAVAYTSPEVAWVGLTETEAVEQGIKFEKASFPWSASGRAISMGESNGLTKILVDPVTHAILGVGIVGAQAGELIAEAALAIEMGAEPADVGLTIHPHPTLSEALAFAADAYEGTLTELYLGR